MENNIETLKYPIGHFNCPEVITDNHIKEWIRVLEEFPTKLKVLVSNLDDEQFNTPYREGGWTVRQLIHHIADSHHHSYTRFKWTLTEDSPIIKAYDQDEWSGLFDAKSAPIELSLTYISALHAKLVFLLKGLTKEQWEMDYIHPEGNVTVSLAENAGKYAWHSNHHFEHIKGLLVRKGWLQ